MLTTGAFALVPFAMSAAPAEAAETAPAVSPAPTVDWGPITKCESGNNPRAQNRSSTASGLYQFLDSSWKAYGGGKYAARAKDATVAQQTEIANSAFRRSGLSPWKASQHCWGGKVDTKAKPKPKPAANLPLVRDVSEPIKPATPAAGGDTYVVKAGDSLARIAASRGVSWQSLWEANKSSVARPHLLHPGDQLQMPKLPGQL